MPIKRLLKRLKVQSSEDVVFQALRADLIREDLRKVLKQARSSEVDVAEVQGGRSCAKA